MTYSTVVCTVKKTTDDVQKNCPKYVEIYSKNKFEEIMHLFRFIIRITLNVFLKTVVLNWHRYFGISPCFGHQVKRMN